MYRSVSTNGSIFFQGRHIRALRGGAVKEETDKQFCRNTYCQALTKYKPIAT